jgi:glycosyltransferase involved in cell wall biosynthesis
MTSFVTTVLNEEKSITQFLESIYAQTKLPDEIIIVDAGSTDNTILKLSEFKIPKGNVPNIKLIFKKGNRSVGRNEGIKKAKGDIILVSDAGCILDKNWVKNITETFKDKKNSVSSGYYFPVCKNVFQRCLAAYTSVMPDRVNPEKFLPSSRSVAFRKPAWQKVKGYPEELDTCEDLVFSQKLKKAGFKFKFIKEAFVYWPQRKNLWQAFKQLFTYAKGDGQAHFIRLQTPFLFARYFIGLILAIGYLLWGNFTSLIALLLLIVAYLLWSIFKNYKYVKKKGALYLLPLLQLISDAAVILGMSLGYLKSLKLFSKDNIGLTIIVSVYSVMLLSVVNWGIPNTSHPFTYHMDEWHQLQAVRSVFKFGTNNIAGAANGPMFQFILSGIYLIPFYFLKIINPFVIKSSVGSLGIQENLFIILRLNTLLFGILSIIILWKTLKRFIKINPFFPTFLFAFSPIWISLSNYFKYDIALMFWLMLSMYQIMKYIEKPSLKLFLVASFVSSLAVCTKISAMPILLVLVIAYLIVFKQTNNKVRIIILGLLTFVVTFVLMGIPDLVLLHKGSYYEYFYSNIVSGPNLTENFILKFPWYLYLLIVQYPILFGISFYLIFIVSLFYVIFKMIYKWLKNKQSERKVIFLLFSLVLFGISLAVLKINAWGNRSLVLLPFMALIVAYLLKDLRKYSKNIYYILLVILLIIQCIQTFDINFIKLRKNTREISSEWFVKNISNKEIIGLENIPIYQGIPDVLLKDYYLQNKSNNINYKFKIVDSKTLNLPQTLVVTNFDFDKVMVRDSEKRKLMSRVFINKYKKIDSFLSNFLIIDKVFNYNDIYFAGLIPLTSIDIYKK